MYVTCINNSKSAEALGRYDLPSIPPYNNHINRYTSKGTGIFSQEEGVKFSVSMGKILL